MTGDEGQGHWIREGIVQYNFLKCFVPDYSYMVPHTVSIHCMDLTTGLETWVYFYQGVVTSQIRGHIIVGKSVQGIIEFVTRSACR